MKKDIDIIAHLAYSINKWYDIAGEDYGVTGKFIAANITPTENGKTVEIYFEENGEKYRTEIWTANDDPIEYAYNVWMENAEFERVS